ncbi:MAG: AMP-binding protein [Alphaproteobacteria bacterium]|nr:AMP-binding protein [Alphaproteobacteria bacterium]
MKGNFSSIGRGLRLSAGRFPDRPALVEVDRLTLTYKALDEGANRLAHYLRQRGVAKGDNVAVLSENSIEHMIALYAINRLGAVSVVLDPKWTAPELARALDFFDCRLLILDQALAANLGASAEGGLELGTLAFESRGATCDLLAQVADQPAADPEAEIGDDEISTIVLTSGTTGFPKGVMRSHRNIEFGCINGVLGKAQDHTNRELSVVPLYYGSGRGSVIGQIYIGATVYILPRFDAERVAAMIGKEEINAIALAPTMCRRLLEVPKLERFDFSSLTALRKAGSPFTRDIMEEIIQRITPNVYQTYASTESGCVTLLKPHEQLARIGSSGRTVWGVEAEVVDAAGEALGAGREGEIRVRSANVFKGYYKAPELDAEVLRDGWFHTGDLGRFDEDGYLFITGRTKDLIKTGSINVAPREVESVLLAMEGIKDAAVFGVPDREWGEAVTAIVVPAPGSRLAREDILAHCKATLAGYKVPKRITIADRIERNDLGKFVPPTAPAGRTPK